MKVAAGLLVLIAGSFAQARFRAVVVPTGSAAGGLNLQELLRAQTAEPLAAAVEDRML
jgi:hypothetical protein